MYFDHRALEISAVAAPAVAAVTTVAAAAAVAVTRSARTISGASAVAAFLEAVARHLEASFEAVKDDLPPVGAGGFPLRRRREVHGADRRCHHDQVRAITEPEAQTIPAKRWRQGSSSSNMCLHPPPLFLCRPRQLEDVMCPTASCALQGTGPSALVLISLVMTVLSTLAGVSYGGYRLARYIRQAGTVKP